MKTKPNAIITMSMKDKEAMISNPESALAYGMAIQWLTKAGIKKVTIKIRPQ